MKNIENLVDAFIALRDVDDEEVVGMIKKQPMTEGKAFPLRGGNDVLEQAREVLNEPEGETELEVIDVNADSLEHLKKKEDYVGQGILQCVRCRNNKFIEMTDLIPNEEDDELYNMEDECPHCKASGYGYELVGQVGKVEKEEPVEETPEVENETKAEDEVTFDNDVEQENKTEDSDALQPTEETEEPEIEILDDDSEDDGMETLEVDEEDDGLPKLGDEVEESFEEDEDEFTYGKDALKEDLNKYAKEAWMMNKVIEHMNNEEAYYGSWLYVWPDGEDEEQCGYDFGDKDSFEDLKDTFIRVYKQFHEDGLYEAPQDVEDYAHQIDDQLGLKQIDNLRKPVSEVLLDKDEEEDYVPVVDDLMDSFIEPENIKSVTIKECTEDECKVVFDGTLEDAPQEIGKVEFKSFNVGEGHLVCNVNKDVVDSPNKLSIFLEYFDDEENDKISVVDVETSEELIEGTKAEILESFSEVEFVSCESPEKLVLSVTGSGLEEVENKGTEEDDLVEEICEANGLAAYRVSNPKSSEYWISESIKTREDLGIIYKNFVEGVNEHLEHKFKAVTGYKTELDIVTEKYGVETKPVEESFNSEQLGTFLELCKKLNLNTMGDVDEFAKAHGNVKDAELLKALKDEADKKLEGCEKKVKSFKDRKELSEAIQACKNNNVPYTVKRSLTEGFRYDLIESDIEDSDEQEVKTEVTTELPDYTVEVEQKGDKIEIELEPKKVEEPELEISDEFEDVIEEPVKEAINEVIEEDGKLIVTGEELREVIKEAFKEYIRATLNPEDLLAELKAQAEGEGITFDESEAKKYIEECISGMKNESLNEGVEEDDEEDGEISDEEYIQEARDYADEILGMSEEQAKKVYDDYDFGNHKPEDEAEKIIYDALVNVLGLNESLTEALSEFSDEAVRYAKEYARENGILENDPDYKEYFDEYRNQYLDKKIYLNPEYNKDNLKYYLQKDIDKYNYGESLTEAKKAKEFDLEEFKNEIKNREYSDEEYKEYGAEDLIYTILDDMNCSGMFNIPAEYCEDPENVTDDEANRYFNELVSKYDLVKVVKGMFNESLTEKNEAFNRKGEWETKIGDRCIIIDCPEQEYSDQEYNKRIKRIGQKGTISYISKTSYSTSYIVKLDDGSSLEVPYCAVKFITDESLNEAKKDEEIDKITDSMEKVETIIGLIDDEVEAVDGYTDAIETIDDSKIPNKEEIISKLHHIKGEELEHIDELREVEALMPSVGELADEPEKTSEPIEEPVEEPTEEEQLIDVPEDLPEVEEEFPVEEGLEDNKEYAVYFLNEGVEQEEFRGCYKDCQEHIDYLNYREDDDCEPCGTFEIRPIVIVVDDKCDDCEPTENCCEPTCEPEVHSEVHCCPVCGKEICECPQEEENAVVLVDTESFDKDINEYFDESYDEAVMYTTTNGTVQDDGKIILEGKLESEYATSNITFTLTPMENLNESLVVESAEKILKSLDYKVTNDLSDEVFTFHFENNTPDSVVFDFNGKVKEEVIKEFEKEFKTEFNVEMIDDISCWEFERNKDFYKKAGMDCSHIKNGLLTTKVIED